MNPRIATWLGASAALGFVLLLVFSRGQGPEHTTTSAPPLDANVAPDTGLRYQLPEAGLELVVPQSSSPPMLSCEEAHRVVEQFHGLRVEPVGKVPEKPFAEATVNWIDPHGFWAVSRANPVGLWVRKHAADLVKILTNGDCRKLSTEVGTLFAGWLKEQRTVYVTAKTSGLKEANAELVPLFEEQDADHETQVRTLGGHVASLPKDDPEIERAILSFEQGVFPELSPEQASSVVFAAALRAYVSVADPHSAWAPLEEESSIYDVGLNAKPPVPLWTSGVRTVVGIRIDAGAKEPLMNGDVLLRIGRHSLAGMSQEQVEQVAIAAEDELHVTEGAWIREGHVHKGLLAGRVSADGGILQTEPSVRISWVPYGEKKVAIMRIQDIRDDLPEDSSMALQAFETGEAQALLIDLRDNGGGSTEAAIRFLGQWIPKAPLFPMIRRDEPTIEYEVAPEPSVTHSPLPLAVLVNGGTASAAEMIAGALKSYGRATVVGSATFGKGCAQEFFDDEVSRGVLKVTTLVFALPDGSPLQRVGIQPTLKLALAPPIDLGPNEREASQSGAPSAWRGADIRDQELLKRLRQTSPEWPAAKGAIGSCEEPDVCKALEVLSMRARTRQTAQRNK